MVVMQTDFQNLATLSSPKFVYVSFLLKLFSEFYTTVLADDNIHNPKIERALATLVAFVPGKAKREYLWDLYSVEKKKTNTFTASIMTLGEAVEYLSDALDFEEHSTAMEL